MILPHDDYEQYIPNVVCVECKNILSADAFRPFNLLSESLGHQFELFVFLDEYDQPLEFGMLYEHLAEEYAEANGLRIRVHTYELAAEDDYEDWKELYDRTLDNGEVAEDDKDAKGDLDKEPPKSGSMSNSEGISPSPALPKSKEQILREVLASKGQQDTKQILDDALAELESLIGLPSVKGEVTRLMSFLNIQQQRRQHGLKGSGQTLHFVFRGNPGSGKTTVARIIGKLLYGFGFLKTTKFIECGRSDLVGGYLGQTAIKTNDKIREALDGVLFIDEAYTLAQKGDDPYGREAIDTLVKRMEDYRDRLTVIVAGYPRLMDEFIASNPGLRSRFTRFLDFEDYSVRELVAIFDKFCNDAQYAPDAGCRRAITTLFTLMYAERDEAFGNARDVRNIYQEATTRLALRLHETPGRVIPKEDLMKLVATDIPLLDKLIEIGKRRGYLTMGQINQYLPDDCNEEEVRSLIETVDRNGIETVGDAEAEERNRYVSGRGEPRS